MNRYKIFRKLVNVQVVSSDSDLPFSTLYRVLIAMRYSLSFCIKVGNFTFENITCFAFPLAYHFFPCCMALTVQSLQGYAASIALAVSQLDGSSLAALLSVRNNALLQQLYRHLSPSVLQSLNNNINDEAPHLVDFQRALRSLDFVNAGNSPWPGIASKHTAIVVHLLKTKQDREEIVLDESTSEPDWGRAYVLQLDIVKWV